MQFHDVHPTLKDGPIRRSTSSIARRYRPYDLSSLIFVLTEEEGIEIHTNQRYFGIVSAFDWPSPHSIPSRNKYERDRNHYVRTVVMSFLARWESRVKHVTHTLLEPLLLPSADLIICSTIARASVLFASSASNRHMSSRELDSA